MADECVLSDIVTEFFLNTCRLHPQPGRHAVEAAARHASIVATFSHSQTDEIIPLTTGSVAEFYIEPMLPHVGDVDVMFHFSSQLAIPQGQQPPTQLPAEFNHICVNVFEIVDSHLPGYVYLKLRYLLIKCTEDNKYNCSDDNNGLYLSNSVVHGYKTDTHGPAVFTDNSDTSQLSFDEVRCIHCLSWPPQAADWPTRHRNYDWPDSATIDHLVNNGCDVVGAVHHECRQNKWRSEHQWRLSFSRAEIVLLSSWMPVQQIAYHMLRYFMKTK